MVGHRANFLLRFFLSRSLPASSRVSLPAPLPALCQCESIKLFTSASHCETEPWLRRPGNDCLPLGYGSVPWTDTVSPFPSGSGLSFPLTRWEEVALPMLVWLLVVSTACSVRADVCRADVHKRLGPEPVGGRFRYDVVLFGQSFFFFSWVQTSGRVVVFSPAGALAWLWLKLTGTLFSVRVDLSWCTHSPTSRLSERGFGGHSQKPHLKNAVKFLKHLGASLVVRGDKGRRVAWAGTLHVELLLCESHLVGIHSQNITVNNTCSLKSSPLSAPRL